MKFKTAFAMLALLAALAAPLPALAQVNRPPTPLSEGLPEDALDRLWCAVFFDASSPGSDNPALTEVFRTMEHRLRNSARDLLKREGAAEEHIRDLEEDYYWQIVATQAVSPASVSQGIAACEAVFYAVANAEAPQATSLSDFECAVVYWTWGGFVPSEQRAAMERVRFAAVRHQQANPGADMAAVEQQMLAEVQARGQRIQQGTESAEQLQADLTACQAQYGF